MYSSGMLRSGLTWRSSTRAFVPLKFELGEAFQFVQFDWNPKGHEPEGVYTLPHFDFHFYTVSDAAVMAIIVPR